MKTLITFVAVCLLSSLSIAQDSHSHADGHNHSHASSAKGKISSADQLQISIQKICPVMGAELGSMGTPLKVQIDGETMFLCCDSCKGKKANPKHWKAIQARFVAAQGTCPIMGKEITSDMESTIVGGHRIYVCCPPCISKIERDVKANLIKLTASYTSFAAAETMVASNQIQITAQQICPVTGSKLGSMGTPVKIKAGKQHIFLCCEGCKKQKINGTHWKTIQANLAAAQGICPIMNKPVTADMEATYVNGRKIFVCCQPCIKQIDKNPAKYVKQLDTLYTASAKKSGTIK